MSQTTLSKFNDAVVDFLTDGNFPSFSCVETEGFQTLIDIAQSKLVLVIITDDLGGKISNMRFKVE